MSSNEWASAADPSYECCSFRGGVAAFHAKDGSLKWKTYSILEVPKDTGKRNPLDVPILAPSGVPVWNSPTIDVKRQLLYVGTGESYTSPAAPTSDAVLAFSLSDGKMVWHKQLLAGDAWNMSCFIGSNFNCPEEDGPDMDIGASVILIEDENKGDVIVVGQKNGVVHGLSPDNSGKIIWQTKIGVGGYAGGVHWGMAADGSKIFAPNADTNFIGRFKDEDRRPGLYAIDAFSGEKIWYKKALDQCKQEDKPACDPGLSAAVSATDGLVFAGGFDGIIKAYNAMDGNILWQYNTNQSFNSISGHHAYGGSIESDGPVLYKGHVLVNSGYLYGSRMAGNVLLNFSID
jgi:polyvinyl alcohol dehydrogenase (cytochrome)